MNTETMDRLYLEYSQITKARTEREQRLASQIRWLLHYGGILLEKPMDDSLRKTWDNRVQMALDVLEDCKV